ncbi:MAG: pyridoxamine 5'-phosphate oxidase family protein [Desulfobacteraceae bacterium]|nr:pyridoxamine 5'-phosphate oxidase family protein [Desulfobacteraceae bacterium]
MLLSIYVDAARVKTTFLPAFQLFENIFASSRVELSCLRTQFERNFKHPGIIPFNDKGIIMRRTDKEITDSVEIESIIQRSLVCRLGMVDENRPYIIPLSFGYKDNTLYFHSANEGRKIDILKRNNTVCFEFDIDCEPIKADNACEWGMKYKSVIGFGKAYFVDGFEAKCAAMDIIMQQYSDETFDYPKTKVKNTVFIRVEIEHMTGKQSGQIA